MRHQILAIVLLVCPGTAVAAEPWVDPDPAEKPERYEIGSIGVQANAEYRAQALFIDPISLNSEVQRRANWIEHRARLGGVIDYEKKIKLTVSLDVLDGVLWGDNGTFGGEPGSDSGLNLTSRNPNVTRACLGYREGDPLKASSYGYVLCEQDPILVRHLYGQVTTPVGALRVGRQPVSLGMAVQTANGEGRSNRFGLNYRGSYVDRIMFATKPLEAFKPKAERDTSEHKGLILATMYDRWVSDGPQFYSDDVSQAATAVRYLQPKLGFLRDVEAQMFYAHRWERQFTSRVNTIGGRAIARLGDFHIGLDMAGNIGTTREVSKAYSVISNDPVVDQQILQFGARGVVRYDQPLWSAYLELDYASGDGDPEARTPLTQFRFAEDSNVGLLMFEHIVNFQSARASMAGVEIIRRLGAETFPAERVHTRGSFTNAFALFPQFDFRPHEDVLLRAGVLMAWAPELVIDQVASLQARDGITIEDDLVNFVGGKPAKYYGTELDARFQWRFMDHFAFDLEGAILFPGKALADVNGQAVRSLLLQGRTTFFF